MSAGVDDPIHIQIQIIKLHIIWIRFTGINWNLYTVAFFWLLLHAVDNDGRVLAAEPAEERRDSHDQRAARNSSRASGRV